MIQFKLDRHYVSIIDRLLKTARNACSETSKLDKQETNPCVCEHCIHLLKSTDIAFSLNKRHHE